jgi:hypothetical protein
MLPTAGTVLSASVALRERRGRAWSDAEVAVLLRLAYESGRTDSYRDDLAEVVCVWSDHLEARPTYEERVAARIECMRTAAGRDRPDHPGGPVDWETGLPLRQPEAVA